MEAESNGHHSKLNQLLATAVCGNDILSSTLYVSGIAILFAGVYAPLILLLVAGVLWLYRAVYTEVVEALPINGGAYNCLLNGTSKTLAAIAGVMTILSYIATAVISAKVAVEYLNTLVSLPIIPITIGLLLIFALLVINGIKDSARVALGIFIFHLLTLTAFLVLGLWLASSNLEHFWLNLRLTTVSLVPEKGWLQMIYLGFAASLLGVSGFESSANFVEEQKKGVFRKTLRNMWLGVAIFNPLIALVILNSLPYVEIIHAKDFLLAESAQAIGGSGFKYLVVIDAFLVLAGAVLTSFVGISGLVHRMAADGCLPNFFTRQNLRGAFPITILTFFGLCSSILLITHGELLSLAGVYTIAFLGVMSAFALGNLVLKQTRTELKRSYLAPVPWVIAAFMGTFAGLVGNILIDVQNVKFFSVYFVPALVGILVMVYQDLCLRTVTKLTQRWRPVHKFLTYRFNNLIQGRFVIFIHHPHRLHQALEYVNKNETGWNLTLVYCNNGNKRQDDENFNTFKRILPELKKAGVYPHFNLNLVRKSQPFGPLVIKQIVKELHINQNRILIGSIHHYHKFDYSDLGGVRIIF